MTQITVTILLFLYAVLNIQNKIIRKNTHNSTTFVDIFFLACVHFVLQIVWIDEYYQKFKCIISTQGRILLFPLEYDCMNLIA